MTQIKDIKAREILDSTGLPTLECQLQLENGLQVTTSVPNAVNTATKEAKKLIDNELQHMVGRGVQGAVDNINQVIKPELIGHDPTQQTAADQLLLDLDGTQNKENLGANTLLAASQAVLKAGAASVQMPLYYYLQQKYQLIDNFEIPTCIYSMLNGGMIGAHNLDLKDFFVIPAGHLDYPNSLNLAVTYYKKLEEVLVTKEAIHCVGQVGGYAPNLYANTDAFEIMIETTKATPYTFAQDLFLGVDISAPSLISDKQYVLSDRSKPYTASEMIEYYQALRNTHQVIYIEDPFAENDWKNWQKITAELGETTQIAADLLLSTNKELLQKAHQKQACNTVSAKPAQAGTMSETIDLIQTAQELGYKTVISHRTGETNDTLLADLAVGVGADFAKFGAPNRGERVAKYNRLMEIYDQLQPETKQQATSSQQVATDNQL